jgi:hypothetical protein
MRVFFITVVTATWVVTKNTAVGGKLGLPTFVATENFRFAVSNFNQSKFPGSLLQNLEALYCTSVLFKSPVKPEGWTGVISL